MPIGCKEFVPKKYLYQWRDKALSLMTKRFGHDTLLSLATMDGNRSQLL